MAFKLESPSPTFPTLPLAGPSCRSLFANSLRQISGPDRHYLERSCTQVFRNSGSSTCDHYHMRSSKSPYRMLPLLGLRPSNITTHTQAWILHREFKVRRQGAKSGARQIVLFDAHPFRSRCAFQISEPASQVLPTNTLPAWQVHPVGSLSCR